MSAYDYMFTATQKRCPLCGLRTVNRLNKMLICEVCGWYQTEKKLFREVENILKPDKRKPMSEFMLNGNADNDNSR